MFLKPNFAILALSLLATSELALGRERWLERDGRAVFLYPRRFGQEQPAVLDKLRTACPGDVCGTLAGKAVTPLLAAQPECSQQDLADEIVDASKQFDATTAAALVAIAIEYRQAEKNTPPDFTTNPPSLRNSVFCQKAPKNAELNGLVQAQDPANDPELFFDPELKATVKKGSQANTAPFGGAAADVPAADEPAAGGENKGVLAADPAEASCATAVTVTVTGTATVAPRAAVTVTAGDAAATAGVPAADPSAGADFGTCSVPQIEFGVGFDNRKETSFQPVDKTSFNHGSAQNIAIITQSICDTLTNSCKANQAAKDLCDQAQTAAAAETPKTGAQADAFNAVFGIQTNFAAVSAIDDQGRVVAGSSSGAGAAAGAADPAPAATDKAAAPAATAAPASDAGAGAVGDFGKCSVPQIEFGVGFDNRKETSFQPVDKASFNHGSAQNIDIITRAICDTLTNSCGADQAAKDTCAKGQAAASAATKGTGAQADAFNAAFGIQTNFDAVTQIDNQGRVVGAAPAAGNNNAGAATPAAGTANSDTTPDAGGAAAAGNLQTFDEALGGVKAPTVTVLANGQFQVEGNAAFANQKSAIVRSCDVQNNQCANAANSAGGKAGFDVGDCNKQQSDCINAAG